MDGHTEHNENKKRSAQPRPGRPRKHRALALLLALVMLLASSGIQAAGQTEAETSEEVSSETTEEEVSLTQDQVTYETEDPQPAEEAAQETEAAQPAEPPADTEEPQITTQETQVGGYTLAADGDYDITNLMTTDSYIEIEVNGTFYTIEELNKLGLKVPKGAVVKAYLKWDDIKGIAKGQKLVYQVPEKMVTNVVEEEPFAFFDENDTYIGTMSLSKTGLFTVEISEGYFDYYTKKQHSDTLQLKYVTLEFSGTLSSSHGETSGGDDAKITFKGETEGEPQSAVEFVIPFEYKNEHSPVDVAKKNVYDAVNQVVKYTVKVSTPKSNTMTSEGVKLTDEFDSTAYLVNDSKCMYGVYGDSGDVKATLYTETNNGTNLTNGTDISNRFAITKSGSAVLDIGDMEPDSVVILEYTVKPSDKYFATTSYPEIKNTALATFNDIKSSVGYNNATSIVRSSGSLKIDKSVGNISADSDGNAYIQYTVKVTAQGGTVADGYVKDYFTQNGNAIKELKDFKVDNNSVNITVADDKSFTWELGTLADKQSTTLTYKAYLDPNYWDLAKNTTIENNAVQLSLRISNRAEAYYGDGTLAGGKTVDKDLTKTWLLKSGVKNSAGSAITYTLKVNADPTNTGVTSIFDNLQTEGATIVYPITLDVYKSSSNQVRVGTGSYSISEGTTGFTSSSTGWNLNLEQYNSALVGSYYYVVTYTVQTGGAAQVKNGAGINRGGYTYGEGTTVDTVTIDANKKVKGVDYVNGVITWETNMNTSVDAGAVYYDWLDSDTTRQYGLWWFSMDDINDVEVYLGDTLIYGIDENGNTVNTYGISVDTYDDPDNCTHWEWGNLHTDPFTVPDQTGKSNGFGLGYCGFKVMFSQAIKASSSNPIYIRYHCSVNADNLYKQSLKQGCDAHPASYINAGGVCSGSGTYPLMYKNKWRWKLACGVSKEDTNGYGSGDEVMLRYSRILDVMKGSQYDSQTGIITWKIYLNRHGDMIGDATVEDTLPAGLEFLSASLSSTTTVSAQELKDDIATGKTYIGDSFATTGGGTGNIKENGVTTETLANGTTKVTVELENLQGYTLTAYEKNEDGTYKRTSDGSLILESTNDTKALREGSWYDNCTVVLTIQTRITDELMVNGVTAGKFVNTATVTNDTMALGSQTATATQPISIATGDNLSKAMNNYVGGTTLTFNMDINSNAEDLIYTRDEDKGTSKDTLEIMDVMGDKMSLATTKSDYFVVTDKDGNKLTLADSENIGKNQYYVTQVEVPADENGNSVTGTAYKIIVPDGMKLHIQYLVTVNAAVGETVQISNKAYFNYDGLRDGSTASTVEVSKVISKMQGSAHAVGDPPEFQIFKQDQFGNPIAGVTFGLYQVTLDSNGEEASATQVATVTTGADGYAKFDSNVTYTNTNKKLDDTAVYYFKEEDVPAGYAKSTEKTYFYFTKQDNLNIAGAVGIDYWEKIFEVTNNFTPASLDVPLTKTINGENQKSTDKFTFTLTKKSGADVYSDKACTTVATTATTATIAGSGTTQFNTLYFNATGEYTFTLSENDLTEAETHEGFTKDATVYTITVTVASGDNGFYVDSATYKSDDGTKFGNLLTNKPVFDNTLTLNPVTVKLAATKKLAYTGNGTDSSGRTIKKGEFTFKVVENGAVIATGTTNAGNTTAEIEFESIEFNQDELGIHYLTIYEDTGTDFTVTYSTVKFLATVVVEPIPGEAQLKATVKYSTKYDEDLDDSGNPVFTNDYITIIVPSGIRLDIVPYAMIAVVAAGVGGLMIVRRRKRS